MLLIRGSQEAFSPADPKTFAEIARETDVLSQELSGSGGLAGAYGVVGQAGAQVIRAADGGFLIASAGASGSKMDRKVQEQPLSVSD
jgi:hypothetical protein